MKYHISPDGMPRLCTALSGNCKFGTKEEHFPSKLEAAKFYEESNSHLLFRTVQNLPKTFDPLLNGDFDLITKDELKLFSKLSRHREHLASLEDTIAYDSWEENLKPDEREAIVAFRNQSKQLNNALRYGGDDPYGYMEDDRVHNSETKLSSVIRTLDQLIAQNGGAVKEPLYHGVQSLELNDAQVNGWIDSMRPGAEIEFKGYISTSLSPLTAQSFRSPGGLLFEMIGDGSMFIDSFEEERVYPHHTAWKIISKKTVEYNGYPLNVIQILRKR